MADTAFELDLDVLEPKGGEVKLAGKVYPVSPPKLKTVIALSKLAAVMSKPKDEITEDEAIKAIEELFNVLKPVMPALVEDGVDLNMEQAGALMGFVMDMASQTDMKKLDELGIKPSVEKKTSQAVS